MYIEEERKALKQAGAEGISREVDGDRDTRMTLSWTGCAGAVQG